MEKNISRRGFLRIGGVAGITAATGGLLASCGTGGDSKKNGSLDASNREWAGEADVIVVGGGGTGFCAAVEALEAGNLDVIIVQDPYKTAYDATMDVYNVLVDGAEMQKVVNIPCTPVTKENMNDDAIKALLNPLLNERS